MVSNNKFKLILNNMRQEEVLNFIWTYDQYVSLTNKERDLNEDWNISPLNIEDFYQKMYKREFRSK